MIKFRCKKAVELNAVDFHAIDGVVKKVESLIKFSPLDEVTVVNEDFKKEQDYDDTKVYFDFQNQTFSLINSKFEEYFEEIN